MAKNVWLVEICGDEFIEYVNKFVEEKFLALPPKAKQYVLEYLAEDIRNELEKPFPDELFKAYLKMPFKAKKQLLAQLDWTDAIHKAFDKDMDRFDDIFRDAIKFANSYK